MGPEFLWIFLVIFISRTGADTCKRETRCKISRVHGMKGADCFDQKIRTIPQCVASDVQILELTQNRLRKIDKNDLKRYTSLKYLYLSDNAIHRISEEAFEDMDELTTLDLSINSLTNVPSVIFQLPSLKTLYLGQNANMNIADSVEQLKISSPLSSLDLSYISDGEETVFPNLGILPTLLKFNISGTEFQITEPRHFAGLCALKILVNINSTTDFIDSCDCWRINQWLKERKVAFTPYKCDKSPDACDTNINLDDLKTYEDCQKQIETIETSRKWNKGLIYGGIVAGILVLSILVYIIYQRTNRIQPKKHQKSKT